MVREAGQSTHCLQRIGGWKIQSASTVLSNPRTLILGIGNPIRFDDGVGPCTALHVKSLLSASERASVEVRCLDAGGWNLIPEIEGFDELIIIDAYYAEDTEPGRVRTHTAKAFDTEARPPDSAHLIGVTDALLLSKNLGYHTPCLLGAVTVDVGDSCLTFGEGLSSKVQAAVPIAAEHVFSLLHQ